MKMKTRTLSFWFLQASGWVFVAYLVYAQGVSALDYDYGVAMGITVYWPIVCLSTVVAVRGAPGWSLPKESDYWIALPLIALWGIWSLWWLLTKSHQRA